MQRGGGGVVSVVVIAPDSFKGSIRAGAAAEAPGRPVSRAVLAARDDLPPGFLDDILRLLRNGRLLRSQRNTILRADELDHAAHLPPRIARPSVLRVNCREDVAVPLQTGPLTRDFRR